MLAAADVAAPSGALRAGRRWRHALPGRVVAGRATRAARHIDAGTTAAAIITAAGEHVARPDAAGKALAAAEARVVTALDGFGPEWPPAQRRHRQGAADQGAQDLASGTRCTPQPRQSIKPLTIHFTASSGAIERSPARLAGSSPARGRKGGEEVGAPEEGPCRRASRTLYCFQSI